MEKVILHDKPEEIHNAVQLIKNSAYFRTVEETLLQVLLESSELLRLEAGDYLIQEGDECDRKVYFLLEGKFKVYAAGKFILTLDQPGLTIGEMAIISPDVKRSADVKASISSSVVAIDSGFIDKNDLKSLTLSSSFLKVFCNILSEKLRITTDRAKLYEEAMLEKEDLNKYNKEIAEVSKDLKRELQHKLEQIKLYSQVVECNQDAIVTADEKGRLQSGNQAFLHLFGYDKEEIDQLGLSDLFSGLEMEADQLYVHFMEGWKGQKVARRKNSDKFPALISISPVRTSENDTDGKLVYATVIRDITIQKEYENKILKANKELKQTYSELENTLQELEKSNKVKDHFLSNISSQLKTPLDSIVNYAEVMKKDMFKVSDDDIETIGLLGQIVNEGQKMDQMVGNLLTLAELSPGASNLSFKVMMFSQFIDELKKETQEFKNISFEFESSITAIVADREKLLKAFLDIFQYAYKERGVQGRIKLNANLDATKNILEVNIILGDPEKVITKQEEIWNEETADGIELSMQKGDLSLPLAKRIIELHNGDMQIQTFGATERVSIHFSIDPNIKYNSRLKVMIIDEHEWDRKILKGIIDKQFVFNEIFEFSSQISALNALNALKPNLIIVDPFFDDAKWEYEEFLNKLMKGHQNTVSTIVFSDELGKLNIRNKITSLGVTDFLLKPFTVEDALFKIKSIIETNQKLVLLSNNIQKAEIDASTDGLTKLRNRKFFDDFVEEQFVQAGLSGGKVSLVMIDVDNFKHYNDTNGHQMGDEVLKKVAAILKGSVRSTDLAARYGGEEFVIVLPSAPKKMAENIAEKMRAAIEEATFPNEEAQPKGTLTASFGVSTFPENGETPDEVLKGADNCLYMAKEQGRNTVVGAVGRIKD